MQGGKGNLGTVGKGKFYFEKGGIHGGIKGLDKIRKKIAKDTNKPFVSTRSIMDVSGRLWKVPKVISFWLYPTKEEFPKVISDIGNAIKQPNMMNDPEWRVEVIIQKSEKFEKSNKYDWSNASEITEYIPLKDYLGSDKRSSEELAQQHIASPMDKLKKPKKSAYFKVRDKKIKPLAWKQAMYAESIEEPHTMSLYEKLLVGEPVTVEELRNILNQKVLNFEFIKLDGEVRPAKGTTMMKYVPEDQRPSGDNPSSDKVATFYDLSKNAWRSVSNKSSEIVLVQDKDTGKLKVQISDKKPKEEPGKPEISKVPGADPRPIPPKIEPIVKPSIKPEVIPPIPEPEDVETEVAPEETPLDIDDPTITADDVEDKDIIAPTVQEPEVEIEEPEEIPDEVKPIVKHTIREPESEDELPPEEDITFPDDDDENIM